jgi:hypothetical protein
LTCAGDPDAGDPDAGDPDPGDGEPEHPARTAAAKARTAVRPLVISAAKLVRY